MDRKNILSEGFFDKLISSLIPQSVINHYADKATAKDKKEMKRLEKEIEKADKQFNDALDNINKRLQKKGIKVPKTKLQQLKSVEKIKKQYGFK